MKFLIVLVSLNAIALAQQEYTTPIPILKQINKHNEDGSYSYGYEGADGSYKIETKFPTGEVQGKYGYVDDSGKLREIEYGASRRGFEPAGTDINVPPPTINNNNPYPLGPNEEDDGQYREDPSIYYKDSRYNTKPARTQTNYIQPQPQPQYQPQPQHYNPGPNQYFQQNIAPAPTAAPVYNPQPQHRFNFQSQPQQQYYQPQYNNYQNHNQLIGHPATNLDLNTGSYSLTYTG